MSFNYLNGHTLPHLRKLSAHLQKPLTFIDLETTGMVHEYNFAIIELGLIHITQDLVVEKNTFIDPKMKIPSHITQLTGITNSMVNGQKEFYNFASYLDKVAQQHILCGYNSKCFDSKGIEKMLKKERIYTSFKNQIDIRYVFLKARKIHDNILHRSGSLIQACEHHNIYLHGSAHRAGYDIALTALLADKLIEKYGVEILKDDIKKLNCTETKERFSDSLKI